MGNDITATLLLFHFSVAVCSRFSTPLTPKRGAVHKLTGTFNHHPTSSYITDELTIKKPSGCSWTSLL